MKTNQIKLILFALACSLAKVMAQTGTFQLPIASGPFVGTGDSLTNYSYPELVDIVS
jgi:hypothetical protein